MESQFEYLLESLGYGVFLLLILSAVVERGVEALRGILDIIRKYKPNLPVIFPATPQGVSLEDALKLTDEFVPEYKREKALSRIAALKQVSQNVKGKSQKLTARIAEMEAVLEEYKDTMQTNDVPKKILETLNNGIAEVSASIKLQDKQRQSVLMVVSATLGVVIAAAADISLFDAFQGTQGIKINSELMSEKGLKALSLGEFITGVAASAGSSYWHDQLGKVRNLKQAFKAGKGLTK